MPAQNEGPRLEHRRGGKGEDQEVDGGGKKQRGVVEEEAFIPHGPAHHGVEEIEGQRLEGVHDDGFRKKGEGGRLP